MYDETQELLAMASAKNLEVKWNAVTKPYTIQSNQFLDRQSIYESNARSYPRRFPLAMVRAEGIYIEDTEGRIFMDCLSGAGALALGHNHPSILNAMQTCINNKSVLLTLDITTPIKDKFVHTLINAFPAEFKENCKIQFCSPCGADAVEAAIKLAKTATGRNGVFAFTGAYHGMTHGALSLTGNKSAKVPIPNLMKDVSFLPYPYHYRCPFGIGGEKAEKISLYYIENILKDSHSGVTLPAALIVEVVQGEGGSIPASNFWIQGIRDITLKYNIPLIIDEVQTGIGRTGSLFAFESSGIIPDVIVISKAIGGSLPLSLIAYHKKLDQWNSGAHAGTFRGNQMAMAAGTAVLDWIFKNNLIENAKIQGEFLISELLKLKGIFPCIGDVRGRGLMLGIEIIDNKKDADLLGSFSPNSNLARKIQEECFKFGLIIETGGREDCVLRFLPPLTLTRTQASQIIHIVQTALEIVCRSTTISLQ